MSAASKNILDALRVSCDNCSLSTLCIPRGLNEQEIQTLDDSVAHKTILQAKETLYKQNEVFTKLYAVKSGAMKAVTSEEGTGDSVIGIFLPGELIGFDGLSTDHHQCTITALETSHVCEIDLDHVQASIPGIYKQLLKHASDFINDSQVKSSLIKTGAENRVISFLLDLSNRHNARGYSSRDFSLYLSRSNIADLLNLSPETVSRVLRNLERKNHISLSGKRVKIIDMDALIEAKEN
jgi:CRP/FNR family transcriptional regulator